MSSSAVFWFWQSTPHWSSFCTPPSRIVIFSVAAAKDLVLETLWKHRVYWVHILEVQIHGVGLCKPFREGLLAASWNVGWHHDRNTCKSQWSLREIGNQSDSGARLALAAPTCCCGNSPRSLEDWHCSHLRIVLPVSCLVLTRCHR